MKGARGLLISITGGNDLTLYEVDEAASRIRQEVDEEANIILGATFDSALDGVVRVSVVATGIDQVAISQIEPVQLRAEPITRPPRAHQPAPAPVRMAAAIEMAPAAMVNDVELQAVAPVAVAFPDPIEVRGEPLEEEALAFIPPAPEQPMVRAPRMPQIEDLPQVAQAQLRAVREAQAAAAAGAPETRRKSLLEKLAAFGITRHEDEVAPRPAPAPVAPPAAQQRAYTTPVAQADYARAQPRPLPARAPAAPTGALDPHGRPAHRPPVTEDDHLDIPAFLRRQQN